MTYVWCDIIHLFALFFHLIGYPERCLCKKYFDWCIFFMIHSIGPINVCTDFEINRYKIDEFRKHAKILCFIWRHVTQIKRYFVRHGGWIPDQRVWLKQWLSWFWWSWPLTYVLFFCHTHWAWSNGISMRSFIRIGHVLMGDIVHGPRGVTVHPPPPSQWTPLINNRDVNAL